MGVADVSRPLPVAASLKTMSREPIEAAPVAVSKISTVHWLLAVAGAVGATGENWKVKMFWPKNQ